MEALFLEFLQLSLGTRTALSRVPCAVEWTAMLKEAQRQAIVGVLLDGLDMLPEGQRPPQILILQWIGRAQAAEQMSTLHRSRAAELTSRFKDAGYASCVLKGVGIGLLYPHPLRRQCGDIDIWVDGDRKGLMMWFDERCEIGHKEWHHVEAKLFKDVQIEVHFHPIWLYCPWYNRRLQHFFETRKAQQMVDRKEGFGYPTLEFNAVYSLVHTFHHLLDEGVGLRHVIDYYYIVANLKEVDLSTIEAINLKIKSFGLWKFLGAMMYVLHEACGMPQDVLLRNPDESAGRFLLDEIMISGNFGKFDKRSRRKENESFLERNWRKFARQLRFVRYYPAEVLSAPFWKLWHKCWRLINT